MRGDCREPRYSKEEFARRGDAIYDRDTRPRLKPGIEGHFVVIDIDSGDCEVDSDEVQASDRLLVRRPSAQVWLRRVGFRCARRYGARQPAKMS